MTSTAAKPAHEDAADRQTVWRLADEYRDAAELLLVRRRKGEPLSMAPYRLIAIHAVELYLNAVLRHHELDDGTIKALGHDLGARARLAAEKGLRLRKRTMAHLEELARNREYVTTRYRPLSVDAPLQINRMQATLKEVSQKAALALASAAQARPGPSA